MIGNRSRFDAGDPGGYWLDMPATKEQLHEAMPVSYTHLDVYKRQGTRTTVILVRTFKDPVSKPCLRTLKPEKSGQLS